MPIYRLTPLEESADSVRWQASTIRPTCLWIRTRDEYEARREVGRATAVEGVVGALPSPWQDKTLVACEYDDDTDVPSGIIRVRDKTVRIQAPTAAQHFVPRPGHA